MPPPSLLVLVPAAWVGLPHSKHHGQQSRQRAGMHALCPRQAGPLGSKKRGRRTRPPKAPSIWAPAGSGTERGGARWPCSGEQVDWHGTMTACYGRDITAQTSHHSAAHSAGGISHLLRAPAPPPRAPSFSPPPKKATLSACARRRECALRKRPSRCSSRLSRPVKSGVTALQGGQCVECVCMVCTCAWGCVFMHAWVCVHTRARVCGGGGFLFFLAGPVRCSTADLWLLRPGTGV